MQDDLVNMMSQHLQINQIQHHQDSSMPPTPEVSPQPIPITYITQHYHHSSHQAGNSPEAQASDFLESVGVNASALLPSQIQLFKNADDQQRQRLVELWTISPPTPGKQMLPSQMGNWPQTSLEQEEAAAQYRWEEKEREKLKNLCALPGYDSQQNAEPYMISGYDVPRLAKSVAPTESRTASHEEQKQFNDPVFNSQSREWWKLEDDAPIEHQYGMLQQWAYTNYVEYDHKRDEDQDML